MTCLRICAAAGLLLGVAHPAAAQTSVPSVTAAEPALPDLGVPVKDLADSRKYFIFHKPGVTVAQAEKDLNFCWRFLAHGDVRWVPDFVPWPMPTAAEQPPNGPNPYGLVGDAILAIVAGPIERSLRQSRLFRCMVPRGYARYRTSEAVWKMLNSGDAVMSIHVQARIAAGPVPPTPKILP